MNRNIPLIVAVGVGVMSGFYIWEPSLKKYQRESKGTWQYEVVQQTRTEEMNQHADAVAGTTTQPASDAAPGFAPNPPTATQSPERHTQDLASNKPPAESKST